MNRGTQLRFEIWCRVVDNFGDAGVCWRLARQLASEWSLPVELRIDRVATLATIEPRARLDALVDGVRILAWDGPVRREPDERTAVVSAFGCDLPPAVRAGLAAPAGGLLWVNLEYLSAEAWVDGCHGLASVKPTDGAVEHFFYPGYTAATGGLIRERGLLDRRDAFRAGGQARDWLASRGIDPAPGELLVSMFCYPDAPLAALCRLLAGEPGPVRLLLAQGVRAALPGVAPDAPRNPGETVRAGSLSVCRVPWLTQDDYDRLLWSCDVNFVRGEDSWVRAQWAGAPFVWQPYRQQEDAHLAKLDAFIARLADADAAAAADTDDGRGDPGGSPATGALLRAWSGRGELGTAWRAYRRAFPAIRRLHRRWTAGQAARPDLASRLVEFCRNRL